MCNLKHQQNSENSAGVAIFYILLACALFAALGFAFTNNMNSVNTTALTEEEGKVFAQDLISFSARLSRGVERVMSRGGCSENDVSFYLLANTDLSGYQHTPEVDDTCKVFDSNGGTITWREPPPSMNDGTNWVFTGNNRVAEVSTDNAGRGNDLIALLSNIDQSICIQVNELLGITNTGGNPPLENDNVDTSAYTGSFSTSTYLQTSAGELDGKTSGCFAATQMDGVNAPGTYHFYHVLIAR